MTEMKIAIVKLLQNFTLETDVNSEIKLMNGDMFMFSYPDFNLKFIKSLSYIKRFAQRKIYKEKERLTK